MSGTLAPIRRDSFEPGEPRRTVSGEQRIDLRTSETIPVGERRELFDEDDLENFVDGALDENPVPVSEGTVRIARFESPILEPTPPAAASSAASPAPTPSPSPSPAPSPALAPPAPQAASLPPWLLQLVAVVPAQYEKHVVAGILFFCLLGVLSLFSGVTILLFAL